jgi:hypothetical protein
MSPSGRIFSTTIFTPWVLAAISLSVAVVQAPVRAQVESFDGGGAAGGGWLG